MVQIKNIIIFIFIGSLSVALVSGHSLYLFDVDLGFDQELEKNTIDAAKKFADTDNDPISFDLDKGLIISHFDLEQSNYVEVNPLGYGFQGMRNENFKHKQGTRTLTQDAGLEIAQNFFDTFADDIKVEYKLDTEVSESDDTYFYSWFRYINNVLVIDEELMINVDAVNSNIIAWRRAIFDFPKENIDTTPAISKNVAMRVAEISFNGPSIADFEPYLIIEKDELIWVTKVQGAFYPIFVGVDAKDGSIAFNGPLPGDVPKSYTFGSNTPVVETDFIKQIYNSK